jgi:acylphosphatase
VAVARRIVVTGRVQGVFFRDATRRRAGELGVTGSARNRADGSVEVVAEGDAEAVDALVAFCREGPPAARVDSVDVTEIPPEGRSGFTIR